jgi:hypothetical protein
LVRRAGLPGRTPKRWRDTTIPDPVATTRADQIRRGFTIDASKLNALWSGDITSCPGGTWNLTATEMPILPYRTRCQHLLKMRVHPS